MLRIASWFTQQLGKDSGFTLTDSEGEVEILHIRGNRENKNHLYLELAREVEDEAELSFVWQADPVKQPPVDEVTFLPLGHYGFNGISTEKLDSYLFKLVRAGARVAIVTWRNKKHTECSFIDMSKEMSKNQLYAMKYAEYAMEQMRRYGIPYP